MHNILLNKIDLLSKTEMNQLLWTIYQLNPTAKIYYTLRSDVPLESILNTNLFNFDEAMCNPGWLREIRGEHTPESEEYGISSFVYRERRPFHPQRLYDLFFSPDSKIRNLYDKIHIKKQDIQIDQDQVIKQKRNHIDKFI